MLTWQEINRMEVLKLMTSLNSKKQGELEHRTDKVIGTVQSINSLILFLSFSVDNFSFYSRTPP